MNITKEQKTKIEFTHDEVIRALANTYPESGLRTAMDGNITVETSADGLNLEGDAEVLQKLRFVQVMIKTVESNTEV